MENIIKENQRVYKTKDNEENFEKEKYIIMNSKLKNKYKIKYFRIINQIFFNEKKINDIRLIADSESKKNVDFKFVEVFDIKDEPKKIRKLKGYSENKKKYINQNIEINKRRQIINYLMLLIFLIIIILFVKGFSNNKLLLFKFWKTTLPLISRRKENKNISNNISFFKDTIFSNNKYYNKVIQTRYMNNIYILSIVSINGLHNFTNLETKIRQNRIDNSVNIESFVSGKYEQTNSNLFNNNDDKSQSKITSWMIMIFEIIYIIFVYEIWVKEKNFFISDNIPPNKQTSEIINSFEIKSESKNIQNTKSKYFNQKNKYEKINDKKIKGNLNYIIIIKFLVIIVIMIQRDTIIIFLTQIIF